MNKYKLESLVFLFFGLFHIHRIWAFIDSKSYNKFWLNILENRGSFFIILGFSLLIMSIIVILYFIVVSINWGRADTFNIIMVIFGGASGFIVEMVQNALFLKVNHGFWACPLIATVSFIKL